jgi:alpha-tubulin suppressor-like RCC1 family protein
VLATFGNGDCGRLGHGTLFPEELPRLVRALLDVEIAAVACGGAHTAVCTADGSVLTFGLNDSGQLGHSMGIGEVATPQEVPLPEKAISVSAGHYHTLCITEGGKVWAWGSNSKGQLGVGKDIEVTHEPRLVGALKGAHVVAASAGMEHTLALTGERLQPPD